MDKKTRRLTLIIGIPILAIIFCTQTILTSLNCGKTKASSSRTYQTLTNFEPTWFLDDIYISRTQNGVNLVAHNENLFMYGTIGRCGNNNLVRFSTTDGEVVSKSASGISVPTYTGVNHIAYDSAHVYLGYDGHRNAPSNVVAYNIDTNIVEWMQPIPITSGSQIGSLTVNEIIGVSTTEFFLLNASTGQILSEPSEGEREYPLSSLGYYAYWYAAINPQSSLSTLEFWAKLTPEIYQPPILLDDIIVFRTAQPGKNVGKVRVFNLQTSDMLWETSENVISNVAIDHTRAYYLTSAAELMALDLQTGAVLGKIEFTSESLEPQDKQGFYIAANDNNVFVYFGDSRRLFAFRFLPDE